MAAISVNEQKSYVENRGEDWLQKDFSGSQYC